MGNNRQVVHRLALSILCLSLAGCLALDTSPSLKSVMPSTVRPAVASPLPLTKSELSTRYSSYRIASVKSADVARTVSPVYLGFSQFRFDRQVTRRGILGYRGELCSFVIITPENQSLFSKGKFDVRCPTFGASGSMVSFDEGRGVDTAGGKFGFKILPKSSAATARARVEELIGIKKDIPASTASKRQLPAKPKVIVPEVGRHFVNLAQKYVSVGNGLTVAGDRYSERASSSVDLEDALVVLSLDEFNAEIKELSTSMQKSRRSVGSVQVPNDAYLTAQAEYQRALTEFSNSRSSSCLGNRPCTVFDFAQTLSHNRIKKQLNEAERKLSRTPAYRTKPVYEDYQFKVVEYEVTKSGIISIARFDPNQINGERASRRIAESQRFKVAYGFDQMDQNRSRSSRYDSEREVEEYEAAPLVIDADLISAVSWREGGSRSSALEMASFSPEAPKADGTLITGSTSSVTTVSDPRFDSVLVVLPASGGSGTGFYVTPTLILTAEHVVAGSRFVQLRAEDGSTFDGRVIDRDPTTDLALISVNRDGKPLKIFSGALQLGQTVEAIGHPKGYEFSITRGVVSALRTQSSVAGSSLARKVEFVQSDTPISNGNSGGPLLLGNQVIGVASWIRVDKGAQNLNFSVSASEVRKYLQANRVDASL